MSTVGASLGSQLIRGANKRLGPLSPKRGNRFHYRGKGGVKGGRITSKGKFLPDISKQRIFVVPDLTGFNLKPYVAGTTPRPGKSEES